MRLLVVSQYFWPENFRINDLVAEMVRRGHQHGVKVLGLRVEQLAEVLEPFRGRKLLERARGLAPGVPGGSSRIPARGIWGLMNLSLKRP